MARILRLEFPGACYHVINRGNYRADIFKTDGAIRQVQEQLGHACLQTTQIYTHVSIRKLKEIHTQTHPGGVTVAST